MCLGYSRVTYDSDESVTGAVIDVLMTHDIVEHGVGEHGEVDEGHARREPLDAREAGPRGPQEHAEPEVIVLDGALYLLAEHVVDVVQLLGPRHRHQAIDLMGGRIFLKLTIG